MILDFKTLQLNWRPNQFLMLPAGFAGAAKPHAVSPVFGLMPVALVLALKKAALAEPRTAVVAEDPASHQIEFVQRSLIFRFPDRITAQAMAVPGGSALAIYSRARYGIRDFGVNQKRVERWLAALPKA